MMTLRSLLASSDVLLQTQFTLLTTGPLPPKSSRSLLPNRRTSTYVSNMVTETNLSQLAIPSPSATPVFYMDTACSTSIVPVVTEVHPNPVECICLFWRWCSCYSFWYDYTRSPLPSRSRIHYTAALPVECRRPRLLIRRGCNRNTYIQHLW